MFSKEYYYLVAGLREWALDSDTKGFDARQIKDEILAELSNSDRKAVEALYGYYDCENLIAYRSHRERFNPLGNLSEKQIAEVFDTRNYALLPTAIAQVVKNYVEAEDEERDEDIVLTDSFEHALFEAYYTMLAGSKSHFLRGWGAFDRNLRNIAAAVAAREAGRSVRDVTVGGGDIVEQLSRSSAADFGLRGEVAYIDAVISAVNDEQNLVEKEHKIDLIRWEQASELAGFDYFNINAVLAYLIKVNIVARWAQLDRKVGAEMFERLLADLNGKERINKL